MRMDTLQLYPDALTMVVLYRGVTSIVEDDASDVLHLVAACDERVDDVRADEAGTSGDENPSH